MKNLFKLAIINLTTYFIVFLYRLSTDHDRSMAIGGSHYINFVATDLLICSVLLLTLSILFRVENKALNIYFFVAMIMCIILSENAQMFHFHYTSDSGDALLSLISTLFFPCSTYSVYVAELKGVTNYISLVMIPYFAVLSILHYVAIKFIDSIKSKLQR